MNIAERTLEVARRAAGREFDEVRDELLVAAGKAAEHRLERRARRHRLAKAGKVAAVLAGAAAVVATGVAVQRARRNGA